jgi:hypothetical protein
MKHIWSVLCRTSSIDRETNLLSLFEVVEGIDVFPQESEISKIKGFPFHMTVVSMWWRSDLAIGELGYECLELIAPNGDRVTALESPELEIDLQTAKRSRIRFNINGFPYVGDGIYTFVVKYREADEQEWRQVDTVPIEINVKPLNEP